MKKINVMVADEMASNVIVKTSLNYELQPVDKPNATDAPGR